MKAFSTIFKRSSQSSKKIVLGIALALSLTSVGLVGASSLSSGKAYAAGDCSGNSIIACGESSRTALVNKIKGDKQLQAVYAHFGLSSADYSRFISEGKSGVAYNNNTIVVDGKVVATDVGSIGNYKSYQGSDPRSFSIGNKTYYGNLNSKAFAHGTKAIPVDVLFNSKGAVEFAVMTGTCANPTYQSPVTPTYACNELKKTAVAGAANTYNFSTSASAGHGATISKVVYNFGDGTTSEQTNPSTVVKHTFTKNSTVTVTVYVNLPGGGSVKLTNADCSKAVTFVPPAAVYACTLLTLTPGKVDSAGNATYALAAKATATNATITSYNFTFGDGKTAVVTSGATAASTEHTYAPGNYAANVSVTVLTNTNVTKTVTSAACAVPVTVKPLECKPGVPVGSPECSSLACVSLNSTPGVVDANGNQSYSFTATATTDNSTITGYAFSFGDSSTVVNSATATVSHTYAPGTYNATVVITGKDASGHTIQAPDNANCAKPVTVAPPTVKNPNISITKTVDGQKSEQVAVNQVFTYQLVIKNTGEKDLVNAVVTDPAPAGVTMLTTDLGTITGNSFSYTIPALAIGDSITVNITAKVTTYVAGSLVNTACVNAPEVNPTQPNQPDSCDTATVTVTPPTPTPTPPAPTVLVNTGAGSMIGLFGAASIIGLVGHRLFLSRRLSR